MITARFFKESEFRACTPSCSLQDMKQDTMDMLDMARQIAGIPFVLTSAYRSRSWDLSKGRSGNGAHTKGKAVDIRCNTNSNRYKIINALLAAGFNRIGIGQNYIHADNDYSLTPNVIWHYY